LQGDLSREALLYAVWLFRLSAEQARSVCDRLHFSMAMRGVVLEANRLGREVADGLTVLKPSGVVSRLEEAREAAVVAAWIATPAQPEARSLLARFLSDWRFVAPKAEGGTLRALGLPPGPAYRHILGALRAAWLDGEIQTGEQEKELLARLVAESIANG
jgi:tRNA nucleotidyltransferase (CCA-adding enzyme)